MSGTGSFTQRVESAWNVVADMLVAFGILLDRHIDMEGMEGYALWSAR